MAKEKGLARVKKIDPDPIGKHARQDGDK